MATVHDLYSDQFYAWEARGRGWKVFPDPVSLEPPFQPFRGHFLPEVQKSDDGLRETVFSSFLKKLGKSLTKDLAPPPAPPETEVEPEPDILIREPVVELKISLPANLKVSDEVFGHFLLSLALCREPISFELLGIGDELTVQLAAHPDDAKLVRRQLESHFPEAVFQIQEGMLEAYWDSSMGDEALVVEFGLAREFMFPLASGKLDPFVGLVGALAELQEGELGIFQVLFEPLQKPWGESIERSVTHADGSPFFVNMKELAAAAKTKIQQPLFGVIVRIAVKSESFDRTLQIARDLAGSLRVFSHPQGNELIPLENRDYPFEDHVEDVIRRQSRRSGMILNCDELIGFVHLPSSAVHSPRFKRETRKSKAAPSSVRGEQGILLGTNVHAQKSTPVRLTPEQRVRHMHILGASGTGKSTLLYNLIRQDIENGEGVAILDPHGDLIDRILGTIPSNRVKDVVLVDPSDEEFSVGFNILSAHSDLEKNLLSSDLVSVFERLSKSWGDQMGSVLQNAILAFLESDEGGTLSDLRRFLIEPAFREKFIKTVRDPDIVYYWRKGFAQLSGNKSIGSVLTRLETFLAPKPIRYMVSQRVNRLNFADILDTGKIFLAKLPQGQMGKENAFLLGSLFVSKFQQMAMSRQAQQAAARKDFWLYIDEFHNFITPSMAEILTGARKYRLGLILAHQELRQLERDREIQSAVLSNPYTRVVFRVGDADARALESGFSGFEMRDLQNLGTGEAIARVERSDFDFNLTIPFAKEPEAEAAAVRRAEVRSASRSRYATARSVIEADILKNLETAADLAPKETTRAKDREKRFEAPVSAVPPAVEQVPHAPPRDKTAPIAIRAEIEEKSKESDVFKPPETSLPPEPLTPKDMGIGGAQHQGIQQRIKATAESLGFGTTIEKQILNRQGSVDVVLEGKGQRIACEISITTTIDHEVGNVRKCLKAGFLKVAVICTSDERLEKIRKAVISCLPTSDSDAVSYYVPDAFLDHLRSLVQTAVVAEEPTLKLGKYKVKTTNATLSSEEAKAREELAVKMIAETMRSRGKK